MACLSVIFNKPEVSYIVFSENPHEIIMGPTFRFKYLLPCCLDCHINRFIFMNGILSVSVATLSTNMNFKSILFRELSICSTKHVMFFQATWIRYPISSTQVTCVPICIIDFAIFIPPYRSSITVYCLSLIL